MPVELSSLVAVLVLVLLFFGALVGTVLFGLKRAGFEAVPVDRSERPLWQRPIFWLGVAAVFLFLGLVVGPRFFGGAFLFLPFFWFGGRQFRQVPRCTSCGERLAGDEAVCPRCGQPV